MNQIKFFTPPKNIEHLDIHSQKKIKPNYVSIKYFVVFGIFENLDTVAPKV